MFIYLDNQTLTQPLPDLLPFFKQSLEDYWENIMSPCEINKGTKKVFQENYAAFYALLGLQDSDTFILSSSTSEITNHLILSTYLDRVRQDGRNGFITSEIEEAPALLGIERLFPLGCQGKMLKVDKHGLVCLDDLTKQLSSRTTFMALSLANGLTGVIQPLETLAEICRDKSIHLHVDISHAIGKSYIDFSDFPADTFCFSSELIHGPKETAALVLKHASLEKKGIFLGPLILGSKDQGGWRAGSLDLGKMSSFRKAQEEMLESIDLMGTEVARLRAKFEKQITEALPSHSQLLFEDSERLPNVSVLSFPGIMNDVLLYHLSKKGIYANIGGGNFQKLSLILEACHMDKIAALGAISFALSRFTTEEEIDIAAEIIVDTVKHLLLTSKHIFA